MVWAKERGYPGRRSRRLAGRPRTATRSSAAGRRHGRFSSVPRCLPRSSGSATDWRRRAGPGRRWRCSRATSRRPSERCDARRRSTRRSAPRATWRWSAPISRMCCSPRAESTRPSRWSTSARALDAGSGVRYEVYWRTAAAKAVVQTSGDPVEAVRLAREAVEIVGRSPNLNLHAEALTMLADVLEATGDRASALAALGAARDLYERKGNALLAERTRATVDRLGGSRPSPVGGDLQPAPRPGARG